MSRTINISTATFAAIWAGRQEGEESEDAILSRILGCERSTSPKVEKQSVGVVDARNGVTFSEGFEIFRVYKRQEYRAVASGGMWQRTDNGECYPTLNQLNNSIADGNENVWNGNWKYSDPTGQQRSIADLRR